MSADRLREALEHVAREFHSLHKLAPYSFQAFETCEHQICYGSRNALAESDAPAPVNVDYGDHDSILMASNAIAEQWARLTLDSQKRSEIRKILRPFFPTITREEKTDGPVSAEQPPAAVAEGEKR